MGFGAYLPYKEGLSEVDMHRAEADLGLRAGLVATRVEGTTWHRREARRQFLCSNPLRFGRVRLFELLTRASLASQDAVPERATTRRFGRDWQP